MANLRVQSKYDIAYVKEFCKAAGFECVSIEYVNSHKRMSFKCREGHTWQATFSDIKNAKHRCPECSKNLNERICRSIFEFLFQKKFPSSRPEWLVSPNGGRMELDGYCRELGLAFERQGIQHYQFVKLFHRKISLENRKKYDEEKHKLCKQHGVVLIEIPYFIESDALCTYITHECQKKGILIPETDLEALPTISTVYYPQKMKELQNLLEKKGIIVLSDTYAGTHSKMKFKCKVCGYVWTGRAHDLKANHGCKRCGIKTRASMRRLTLQNIQTLGKTRKLQCLSKNYENIKTKLTWKCERCGNIYYASVASVSRSERCPNCANKQRTSNLNSYWAVRGTRYSIDDVKKLIKNRSIVCLSNKYRSCSDKLRWKCKLCGCIWSAIFASIKSGTGCPACARKKRASVLIVYSKMRKKVVNSPRRKK